MSKTSASWYCVDGGLHESIVKPSILYSELCISQLKCYHWPGKVILNISTMCQASDVNIWINSNVLEVSSDRNYKDATNNFTLTRRNSGVIFPFAYVNIKVTWNKRRGQRSFLKIALCHPVLEYSNFLWLPNSADSYCSFWSPYLSCVAHNGGRYCSSGRWFSRLLWLRLQKPFTGEWWWLRMKEVRRLGAMGIEVRLGGSAWLLRYGESMSMKKAVPLRFYTTE